MNPPKQVRYWIFKIHTFVAEKKSKDIKIKEKNKIVANTIKNECIMNGSKVVPILKTKLI